MGLRKDRICVDRLGLPAEPLPWLCVLLGCLRIRLGAGRQWPRGKAAGSGRSAAIQAGCSLCHGSDGRGTDRAPTMVDPPQLRSMSDSEIATVITKGKNRMPAFPLPSADIDRWSAIFGR